MTYVKTRCISSYSESIKTRPFTAAKYKCGRGSFVGSPPPPPPPPQKNIFLFLFLLPIACLNFEQTIAGISISIHFRTVVANFNNLQIRFVICSVLTRLRWKPPNKTIFFENHLNNLLLEMIKGKGAFITKKYIFLKISIMATS